MNQDFDAFYQQTKDQYARAVGRILSEPEESEEVLQDGWLKIWLHWDDFDGRTARRTTWGHAIMMRTAIDAYRRHHGDPKRREARKTPHVTFLSFDLEAFDTPDEQDSPETWVLQHEDTSFVIEVWRLLEPSQRLAIQLSALPHTEIERRYDIPVYISKNRRKRALEAAAKIADELRTQERMAS